MIEKARRIDNSEWIEGYYFEDRIWNAKDNLKKWITIKTGKIDYAEYESECDYEEEYEINQQTLRYSFDNGASWYSEDELKMILGNKSESYDCTDFNLSFNDIKMRKKEVKQPSNGSIFRVTISDR